MLADVAGWRERHGRPIDCAGGEMVPLAELAATLEDQAATLERGDVLLIRFGWLAWWRSAGRPDPGFPLVPGLEPSLAAAEFLWDSHIAAVGGDPGLDPFPGKFAAPFPEPHAFEDPDFALSFSLHNVIPYLGLSLGEFLDLDALAADCSEDEDWTFQLTVAPIQLPGGVATPANALAIR